jgi:dihydrofolate reductase
MLRASRGTSRLLVDLLLVRQTEKHKLTPWSQGPALQMLCDRARSVHVTAGRRRGERCGLAGASVIRGDRGLLCPRRAKNGRRMYETKVYWETAHTVRDQPQFALDLARRWQATEKIVYSRTLAEPRSARTRIEREFDPGAVRRLKADAEHDIAVGGPELAAQAIRASLVDEFQMIVCPVVVSSGKRFFPDGVRLNLELVEERRFRKSVIFLRDAVRGSSS